jgi:hypothetical protein
MLICGHTLLLVLRTLLTDMIARVEGAAGSTLVSLVGEQSRERDDTLTTVQNAPPPLPSGL